MRRSTIFSIKQRNWVVGLTLAAVVLGLPLLRGLSFDFNPLNLRSKHVESVSTLLDLMRDPDTSPNTIDILEPNLAGASAMAEKLKQLPEVAKVRTLESFVPKDQDEKLAIIDDANFFFANTLNPDPIDPAPTPAQTLEAINKTAADLATDDGQSGHSGRRAGAPPGERAHRFGEGAARDQRGGGARAGYAAHDDASPGSRSPLGRARDDRHASALRSKATGSRPTARSGSRRGQAGTGMTMPSCIGSSTRCARSRRRRAAAPVFIVEAAATIVKAFLQAAVWSLLSIALILFVALRRWQDVALTLVPLLVAILFTLEICVAIGLKLNFANIIALPLLLGVGVAFKIYYVMAWRAGEHNFLQSSLTRAVFFSACTTATAFGSLWFSHHPGTSSMGKLMALSLVTTLSAAVLFQPALLATQSKSHHDE